MNKSIYSENHQFNYGPNLWPPWTTSRGSSVDNVISASKCGNQVVATNSAVTTFAKLKKLELSESKCARLHIGKSKCDHCPKISVNGKPIKESQKEKYLGDYLTSYASPAATLQDRKCKGYGILGEIRAILNDISLGPKRLETGLTLRESWFLNGTLYNSDRGLV